MPLNTLHDSENSLASSVASAEAAQGAPVAGSHLEIPEDTSLPQFYGVDLINLLPQSPARLFLHWNLAHDPFEMLHKILGADANNYRLVVCLMNEDSGEKSWHAATESRAMWFDVTSGATYRAQIILHAEHRPPIHLLTSDATTAPRREVAPLGDDEPEFHTEPKTFVQILHDTGYKYDALAVALENDISTRLDDSTLQLAFSLTGVEVPFLRDDEMDELRALLAAIAFGNSLDSFQIESPALAAWLERVRGFDESAAEDFISETQREDRTFETTYGGSDVHFVSSPRDKTYDKKLQPRAIQTARQPRSSSMNPSRVWLPHCATSGDF